MKLRIARPRAALVIAPHADDETIGAYGLIDALRRRGTRIHVLVVTDGAASHGASRRWPRARLVTARRRESRRAMRRLGLAASKVRFLALPDGALAGSQRQASQAIRRAIAHVRGLDLVVAPARDDDHPDHRAVAAAVSETRHPARRLGYRVWPPTYRREPRTMVHLIGGGTLGKRSVLRGYCTQMGAIIDDPAGFAIAPHEFAAFTRPVERFVAVRR